MMTLAAEVSPDAWHEATGAETSPASIQGGGRLR